MPLTREDLATELRALGLRADDCVMVHASVRAVGPVHGGPDEIHRAVVDAVEPSGAMLMYLGCPDGIDDIGRGVLSSDDEAALRESNVIWDHRTARAARSHGVLAEFFRTFPDTEVTEHPTRFGARGGIVAVSALLASQPWDFALGHGSPLERLCLLGGKVLLLGSDRDAVTLLHYAEHIADMPDRVVTRFEVPLMRGGIRVWEPCLEVDSNRAHPNWPERFFATIVNAFIVERSGTGEAVVAQVGNAQAALLDAAALTRFAVPLMEARSRGLA